MKYYHGTSSIHLDSILSEGLKKDAEKLWKCSQEGVYLWEREGIPAGSYEKGINRGRYQAYVNGQLSLPKTGDDTIIVMEVDIESSYVEDDTSCANSLGAKFYPDTIPPEQILNIYKRKVSRGTINNAITYLFRNTNFDRSKVHPKYQKYNREIADSDDYKDTGWELIYSQQLQTI